MGKTIIQSSLVLKDTDIFRFQPYLLVMISVMICARKRAKFLTYDISFNPHNHLRVVTVGNLQLPNLKHNFM